MDPSQNVDLNIPLERALKELLNVLFSLDELAQVVDSQRKALKWLIFATTQYFFPLSKMEKIFT